MYFTWLLRFFFVFFLSHTSHHKYIFLFLHWVFFFFFFPFLYESFKVMHSVFLYTGKVSASVSFIKSNQYYLSFSHLLSFLFSSHHLTLYCCSVISWAFWSGLGWTDLYEMMLFLVTWWYFLCEDCLLLFYSSLFYLRCPLEFSSTKVHFLNIYK